MKFSSLPQYSRPLNKRPRIVIVGAGFGGLQTAMSLRWVQADVVLIDRNPYHTFVPLLYQVATATLDPALIARPLRRFLRGRKNLRFLQTSVERINMQTQQIQTNTLTLSYDYLVLATGSRPLALDIPGGIEHGFLLNRLVDAIALRNQILHCFEQASQQRSPLESLLTFAIVGGGATGVELAGALVEMIHDLLRRQYPALSWAQVRIVMIHRGEQLLPEFPSPLGRYTCQKLRKLGVEVRLNASVEGVTSTAVILADGDILDCATTLWTAGVEANVPSMHQSPTLGPKGKLRVTSTLQLTDFSNVYALGDVADWTSPTQSLAGVAPEALQQGVKTARNLKRQLKGLSPVPFWYFNKGRLAIIGCFAGVGKIGPICVSGFMGWLFWLAVHWVYLPGVRNRLGVLRLWLRTYGCGDRPLPHIRDFSTVSSSVLFK